MYLSSFNNMLSCLSCEPYTVSRSEQFIRAIKSRDDDEVRRLIVILNDKSDSPLLFMCNQYYFWLSGDGLESFIIKKILHMGCELNLQDHNGDSALMLACKNGSYEFVKILVTQGANINLQNNQTKSALMIAYEYKYYKICEFLVRQSKCNVNLTDVCGSSMIFYTLGTRDPLYHLLLENGANPNIRNLHKESLFFLMVKYRFDYDEAGMAFIQKIIHKQHRLVPLIPNKYGETVLMNMCTQEHPSNVIYNYIFSIFNNKYSINMTDSAGDTALHYACRSDGNIQSFKTLIHRGANINARNHDMQTPLMYCCRSCDWNKINYLISRNADTTLVDNRNWNLLMFVCYNSRNAKKNGDEQKYIKIIELLLNFDCNAINAKDNFGQNAMMLLDRAHWATQSIIDVLEYYKYDVFGKQINNNELLVEGHNIWDLQKLNTTIRNNFKRIFSKTIRKPSDIQHISSQNFTNLPLKKSLKTIIEHKTDSDIESTFEPIDSITESKIDKYVNELIKESVDELTIEVNHDMMVNPIITETSKINEAEADFENEAEEDFINEEIKKTVSKLVDNIFKNVIDGVKEDTIDTNNSLNNNNEELIPLTNETLTTPNMSEIIGTLTLPSEIMINNNDSNVKDCDDVENTSNYDSDGEWSLVD